MQKIDFYQGFEGNPELMLIHKNQEDVAQTVVHLWTGYFDPIIEQIPLNTLGHWEGLTLAYHQHEAWYEVPAWKCPDPALYLKQLQQVPTLSLQNAEPPIYQVWETLITLLKSVVKQKGTLWFYYH